MAGQSKVVTLPNHGVGVPPLGTHSFRMVSLQWRENLVMFPAMWEELSCRERDAARGREETRVWDCPVIGFHLVIEAWLLLHPGLLGFWRQIGSPCGLSGVPLGGCHLKGPSQVPGAEFSLIFSLSQQTGSAGGSGQPFSQRQWLTHPNDQSHLAWPL